MTSMNDSSKSNHDDRLAEFTDRILNGQAVQVDSDLDDELRGLEQTILKLNRVIPPLSMDEAALKQLQVRLNARIRRETVPSGQSLWERLFPALRAPYSIRPQVGITVAILALVLVLLLLSPSLTAAGPSTTATALNPVKNIALALLLAGAILFIIRITRRR